VPKVEFHIEPEMADSADPRLIRIVLANLLQNAWKFSSKKAEARIDFGKLTNPEEMKAQEEPAAEERTR
jgi:K+-sensing histidine kinase KdpD